METFSALAAKLYDNGADRLIPLRSNDKAPRHKGWEQYNGKPVSPDLLDRWIARGTYDGIGQAAGGALFGLDLDHKEHELALTVRGIADEICGPSPVWRIGEPHKSMRFYRQETPIRTQAPIGIMAASYGTTGQFVLHHPRHPKTGKPYFYPDGETLLDVPVAQLPLINAEQVTTFFDELRRLIPPTTHDFRETGAGRYEVANDVRTAWEELRDDGWQFDAAIRYIMKTATERHPTMTGIVAFLTAAGWEDQRILDLVAEPFLSHFTGREIVTRYYALERSIEGAHRKGIANDPTHLIRATGFGNWGRRS